MSRKNRSSYTTGQKAKTTVFYVCCVAAFLMAAAVITFVVYTLRMRTEFRETAVIINDVVRETPAETAVISHGSESFPCTTQVLDYYDQFLLGPKTVVYSRKKAEETDKTIRLTLGQNELAFTGEEDGSSIAVRWTTPEGEKNYKLRSQTTFMQLESYYMNYRRKCLSSN